MNSDAPPTMAALVERGKRERLKPPIGIANNSEKEMEAVVRLVEGMNAGLRVTQEMNAALNLALRRLPHGRQQL